MVYCMVVVSVCRLSSCCQLRRRSGAHRRRVSSPPGRLPVHARSTQTTLRAACVVTGRIYQSTLRDSELRADDDRAEHRGRRRSGTFARHQSAQSLVYYRARRIDDNLAASCRTRTNNIELLSVSTSCADDQQHRAASAQSRRLHASQLNVACRARRAAILLDGVA